MVGKVDQGRHFVLGVGYDNTETNFYVNDPGFNREYYNYTGIQQDIEREQKRVVRVCRRARGVYRG